MKEIKNELYTIWAEKLNYHLMHDLFGSLQTHVYWELDDLFHGGQSIELNTALQ